MRDTIIAIVEPIPDNDWFVKIELATIVSTIGIIYGMYLAETRIRGSNIATVRSNKKTTYNSSILLY